MVSTATAADLSGRRLDAFRLIPGFNLIWRCIMDCEWAKPHPKVSTQWDHWVLWDDGCDEDGNFIGHCPLHDTARKVEGSAEFNFIKGIMRCNAECHQGKRAMSLTNVMKAMNDATGN